MSNSTIASLTCFSLSVTDHIAHLVLNKPESLNTIPHVLARAR